MNNAPRRKINTDKWNTRISVVANIGVVIGLFLLIFEIRQNTEMMRAQMHSDSMSIRLQRRFDYANSGEIAGIYGKLTAGMGEAFLEPTAEALALLSEEELYRFRSDTIGMRDHLADLFYQCQSEYLDDEFCDYRLRNQIAAMLKIWAAAEILIIGQRPSFLREIQRIGREEGLPIPNDEGRWD